MYAFIIKISVGGGSFEGNIKGMETRSGIAIWPYEVVVLGL
jgi:hypothetical protein